jgi:hypothetical protein
MGKLRLRLVTSLTGSLALRPPSHSRGSRSHSRSLAEPALDVARHTTKSEVNGEACERGKAAEQSRRNADAMARRRQRIVLSRGVHQDVDITPYWREKTHGPCPHVLPEQTRPSFAANLRA